MVDRTLLVPSRQSVGPRRIHSSALECLADSDRPTSLETDQQVEGRDLGTGASASCVHGAAQHGFADGIVGEIRPKAWPSPRMDEKAELMTERGGIDSYSLEFTRDGV